MQNISEHSEKLESDAAQQTEGKERYVLRAGGAVGAGALIAVLLLHGAGVWGLMYGMGTKASVPVEHPPIKAEMLPPPQPEACQSGARSFRHHFLVQQLH